MTTYGTSLSNSHPVPVTHLPARISSVCTVHNNPRVLTIAQNAFLLLSVLVRETPVCDSILYLCSVRLYLYLLSRPSHSSLIGYIAH